MFKVGELVFSGQFGVGEVTGLEDMAGQEFYSIQSIENTVKVFIAVDNAGTLRVLKSKDEINDLLTTLKETPSPRDFDSKKDRINFYKDEVKTNDPIKQYQLLNEMHSIDDRGKSEDSALSKQLDSLAMEIKFIFDLDLPAAQDMLLENLKKEAS